MAQKRKIPTQIRNTVGERDQGKCQWDDCELTRGNGDRMNLHHVHPEQFGGTEDPNNLITLCDIHHKMMHAEFHAFYPDSEGILRKMNHLVRLTLSKYRRTLKIDDGYDLTPYLLFLTNNKKFRAGQLDAIRTALSGKDVLFVTPTGSGKSVCYQLPGLLASDPTLVISPLKALMKDQVQSIWSRKIPTTYINSDLAEDEKNKRYEFIKKKLYKFIFVAPERFESKAYQTRELYTKYAYLVIDEAHEVEMWGMAFRPSYRKLGVLRESLGNPPVIALTATATKDTQIAVLHSLGIPDAKTIVTGFYRDNIEIIIHKAGFIDDDNKLSIGKEKYILNLIASNPHQKILIFTPTIKIAEELLGFLHKNDIFADMYHGKLDAKQKMNVQNQFSDIAEPHLNILVSTSAFGMGIDISNIRHIVHYSPPLSITDYVQQIGRAGRDGKQSYAHLLFNPRDFSLMEFLALLPIQGKNFAEKHDYSSDDILKVEEKLQKQINEMVEFTSVTQQNAWNHILEYFGEQKPSWWQKYGLKIADTILYTIMGVCLFLIALYLVNLIAVSLYTSGI